MHVLTLVRWGKSTRTSHASSAKHKERLKNYHPLSSLFLTIETSAKQNMFKTSEKIDTMLTAVSVSHAEIRWVLKY